MPGTHLCGHSAGAHLSGCGARNTGRLPGQRYEIFRSMRPDRQNSERSPRQNGVHPPGKTAKVRSGKTACIRPGKTAKVRNIHPSRQNCGGTRRQDARSRPPGRIPPHRSHISARRNLRRHRSAGPDAADAARSRSAFVAAKQGPNRRPKDSVLQKKRSGAIWSDKSQVFFKIF